VTGPQPGDPQSAERPAIGRLTVEHGVIDLDGAPPPGETVHIALQAAVLTAHAEPGAALLDWFAAHRHEPLTWDPADTSTLVRLLRTHGPSGWQLLETTGVLERALPEIAAALHRRRAATTGSAEPLSVFRFRVAERLDDLAIETGHPSDDLVLAGLVVDGCSEAASPQPCWSSLLDRLLPQAEAVRISAIVSDARLLRASANDPRGFEEREILQLATHLGSTAHTGAAYQLALALGALTTNNRGTLDERRGLIDEAFDHPELTGSEATDLAAARRLTAQGMATDDAVIERLRFAPVSYVLSHTSEELAAQARLIDPLPLTGCVRVSVAPAGEPNRWTIAVACRDARALLAHLTGVLTRRGLDIIDATIGTWPDGAVLDSFVVQSTDAPSPSELADDFERSLRRRLRSPVGIDLIAEFNNEVLPWHTVCDVKGPDQPGALLAISAAFARAKVVVYSARIATTEHTIEDRFTISDRLGRKLDAPSIERVERALAGEWKSMGSSDVVGRS
jgi:hypothetical protein